MNEREVGGEPVADIRVRYAPLKGIVIPEEFVPLAIDELDGMVGVTEAVVGKSEK